MSAAGREASITSATPALTPGLLALLAVAIGAVGGTIHYHTPMLAVLVKEFGTTMSVAGWIPTMALSGFTAGALFITPLGDAVDKKFLVLGKQFALIIALIVMATASSIGVMIVTAFVIGVGASQSQDLVPLAAQLAKPGEGGKVVGIMLSGLMLGILFGRVVGGLLTDLIGWRGAYWLAAALITVVTPFLAWRLPRTPHGTQLGYMALLGSLASLVRGSKTLRLASMSQGLLGICYGAFWSTVAAMLESIHGYGSSAAGLMGIPGAAGVLIAAPVGKWVDRRGPRPAVLAGSALVILAYVTFGFGLMSVVAVVIGAILLDCGIRTTSVANQAEVNAIDPNARSRMNTVFITTLFGGNALGALLGSYALTHWGWLGVCAIAILSAMTALVVYARSRPAR